MIREAIVNSVCHRNYFEKGARVTVEIYDDRVEITNPGGICKGITPENFGKISITRNSIIASMLYRIDYIEQMGTGILRMKNAAKTAKVAEPKFDLHNFFRVTFARNQAIADSLSLALFRVNVTLKKSCRSNLGSATFAVLAAFFILKMPVPICSI